MRSLASGSGKGKAAGEDGELLAFDGLGELLLVLDLAGEMGEEVVDDEYRIIGVFSDLNTLKFDPSAFTIRPWRDKGMVTHWYFLIPP